MTRKPAILVALIFLLVVGGGAFYLHLNSQVRPEISDVDQFLRQFPASTGWKMTENDQYEFSAETGPRWLRRLGFHRSKKIHHVRYCFPSPRPRPAVNVIVHDGKRILNVNIHAGREEVKSFCPHLLERFPSLRHILRVIPAYR